MMTASWRCPPHLPLLTALQPSFARISEMGIRYSAVVGHTAELAEALKIELSAKWRDYRGIEIQNFGVSSMKADEEDEKMIKELQRNAAFMDPTRAAAHMVGRQDFQSFCDLKNSKNSTVRRVDSIEIYRENTDIVLDFTGEGFLYHMVRIMTGTLADVGAHRILPGQIPAILAAKDRKQAGILAPACGLMLMEVTY